MTTPTRLPFGKVHRRVHSLSKRSKYNKILSIILEAGWTDDEYWDTVKAMWKEIDEVLAKYGVEEYGPID